MALARLGDERAVVPLVHAVRYWRSFAAAEALRMFGGAAVESVLELLPHPNWYVRWLACHALEAEHNAYEIEALLQAALYDKNARVQCAASEALARIGRPTLECIQSLLQDESTYIRERAADTAQGVHFKLAAQRPQS